MVYDPQKELLGEFADHGYCVEEYEDARVVCYKDKQIGAYIKTATPATLQRCCLHHEARMREAAGVAS